jgi:DNA-directed RNA polymerase beta subunit
LNKSALDRGLFSIQANKVFVVEEKCVNSIEKICMPPPDMRKLHFNYSHLDADGIVKLKTKVKGGDIIVGRLVTRINKKDYTTYDDSIAIKPNDEGQVVKIERNPGKTGMVVKIMISTCRVPEIGDKFCSNSAQKGTCGMIFDQEDMPFNSQGMCPDLIV